jgi:hypothetical protein
VVAPLLERVVAYRGKTKAINDPFVSKILEKYAGWSKFLLVDSYGNFQTVGGGVQKEGYWVSNDYSFQESYREPKENKTYSYPTYTSPSSSKHAPTTVWSQKDIEDAEYDDMAGWGSKSVAPFQDTTGSASCSSPSQASTSTKPLDDDPWPPDEPLELTEKTKFLELLGLDDLLDLASFGENDLLDMINEYPEVMTVCMRDLVLDLKRTRERLASYVK